MNRAGFDAIVEALKCTDATLNTYPPEDGSHARYVGVLLEPWINMTDVLNALNNAGLLERTGVVDTGLRYGPHLRFLAVRNDEMSFEDMNCR